MYIKYELIILLNKWINYIIYVSLTLIIIKLIIVCMTFITKNINNCVAYELKLIINYINFTTIIIK